MKNTILLLVTILSISCKAQQTYSLSNYDSKNLKNNNYIKDIDGILNKFVGSWVWENTTTKLTIVFTKKEHWNPNNFSNFFEDIIVGNYQLEENGITVINTLGHLSDNLYDFDNFPNILTNINQAPFGSLRVRIFDILKSKRCQGNFDIIDVNTSPLTAHWEIFDIETFYPDGSPPRLPEHSIPTDIILTKQ
jgi:hypothetical protein